MILEDVLRILRSSGGPVSGENISKKLGVSRAAVWKAVEALRSEGYIIESAPRKGYRLVASPDVLREGEILACISAKAVQRRIICLDSVDSTNTECKRRALNEDTEGLVIIADEQTGGRGRLGRSFSSPKGKGLYFSAVIKPDVGPGEVASITAWTGVAACNAVEKICGVRPQIKWTNDLILGNKKLGGILTEMEVDVETGSIKYVIPGIGININHSALDFPEDVRGIATSVFMETSKLTRRADLAAALIEELDIMTSQFPKEKGKWLDQYRKDCCTTGRDVRLAYASGKTEYAFAEDIDDDFQLIIRRPDGSRQHISSADVSVRGLWGYV